MQCPTCQQVNPPRARFCNGCGARLEAVCRACGHANAGGSRFCNQCGQPLVAAAPPPPPSRFTVPQAYIPRHLADRILQARPTLEGERKQVTVLFADLKGSMELLADRDPEEARKILDPVLERMMEAVHRYEGTVNQVMGDGIMALFGAPLAHEDHAVRACYGALAIQQAIRRYSDEVRRAQGVAVQARVGLNSGEVVVRAIGNDLRLDYSAVGQTTHLAARMEQLAPPGGVLITARTLQLAEGYLEVKPLGPVPVKGLPHPVETYELLGARPVRSRLQAATGRGLTRFVGREAELDQMRHARDRVRGGHGQVVALVGEPGVGKSRLIWEFIHARRPLEWLILEGRSVSYGKGTAYLPVVDLLRAYFGVGEQDDVRTYRERVTGKVLTLDETLKGSLPPLLALLDALPEDDPFRGLDPSERGRRTLEAVKRILFREAQVQPVLVVFEDLHWIDPETQALLDGLVESLPAAQMLLLVTYRPEYQHAWGSKSYYTQLRLDPLPPESAEELLGGLLGPDPGVQALKPLLIGRAQGNPFFLEESVRALAETKMLLGERGTYRLAGPLHAIQVPPTVQAVLAARIDRLPPEEKRVLQAASVIGGDVALPILQAISELPEADLRRVLGHLQAAEFLYEAHLFPELEYAFAHALTLEVAYQGLLQERRRALHASIVEAIERLYPDRLPDQVHRLAHHAFRGEVWGKALAYLRQADAGTSPTILDAYLEGGGVESPGFLWWRGDHQQAIHFAERDLHVAVDFGNFGLKLVSNFRLGQAYHSLGEYERAVGVLQRNVASLRGDLERQHFGMAGLPAVLSRSWLGWCLAERGEFAEALARVEEGIRIAEAAGDPYSQVVAYLAAGIVPLLQGHGGQAIPPLERGLVLGRVEGVPRLVPFLASSLGAAYLLGGRIAEGVPLLEEGVERAASLELMADQARRLGWLAEGHLLAGRPEQAGEVVRRALALSREHKERGHEAYALRLLGDLASRRAPADLEAAAAYREALALAEDLGMRPLAARCHLGLGTLYDRAGDRQRAEPHRATAAALFRDLDMALWLGRAAER